MTRDTLVQNLDAALDLTKMLPQGNLQFKMYGGCSDIWFGRLLNGTQVAVKRARISGTEDAEKKFIKVGICILHSRDWGLKFISEFGENCASGSHWIMRIYILYWVSQRSPT